MSVHPNVERLRVAHDTSFFFFLTCSLPKHDRLIDRSNNNSTNNDENGIVIIMSPRFIITYTLWGRDAIAHCNNMSCASRRPVRRNTRRSGQRRPRSQDNVSDPPR